MKIIIDIDNTLVDYRKSLFTFIKKSKVNLKGISPDYKMIELKNHIKKNLGDYFWQNVQAYIYSDKSDDVTLYKNSSNFIKKAYQENAEIFLVSHKTKFGLHKAKNINIREISSKRISCWLNKEKIRGYIKEIIFTDSFAEKISIIKNIDPSILIDDLLEIHTKTIENRKNNDRYTNILFEGNYINNSITLFNGIAIANTWQEITEFVFN